MELVNISNFKQIKTEALTDVKFIALITTSWHLDNLVAYISVNELQNGVVIVQPQGNLKNSTRFRLIKEHFILLEHLFSKVYFLEDPYITINIISIFRNQFCSRKKTLPLIVPNTRISIRLISSLIKLRVSFKHVIIDEGLSCYLPFEDIVSAGQHYNRIRLKINNLLNMLITNILIKKFCNKTEDFRLFSNFNNKFICNSNVSEALNIIYTNRNNIANELYDCNNILIFKDVIVSNEIDIYIFTHLLDYLKKYNSNIYIKKHPIDINSSFDHFLQQYNNVKLLETEKSGEELVAYYKPKLIIGGYTTVLFSSANIFKLKSISFMMIYLNLKDIDENIAKNILFFKNKFDENGYLEFPNTIDLFLNTIMTNL